MFSGKDIRIQFRPPFQLAIETPLAPISCPHNPPL